jgi:hypothetical protein
MAPKQKRKTWFFLLVLILLSQGNATAQDATLNNIIVNNTRDHLLLFLEVEGAFREKLEKAILSGVPTSFSFFVTLHRIRSFWINEKIADISVVHTIKYNNLKKEFVVTRSWEPGKSTLTRSFEEAQKLMSEIKSLRIVSLDTLTKGSQYQIKAKAELSKLTLPLYLHYVLFFVSLWDFETDWYTIDFTY